MSVFCKQYRSVIIIFFVWFFVINLFGLLALNWLDFEWGNAYAWMDYADREQTESWNLSDIHARWDSEWYLDIAENGYSYHEGDILSNVVFFPLYPMLMRLTALFFKGNIVLAGWLVSTVFLFLALLYLFKLVREFHPELDPRLCLILMLVFPTAIFLNAIYAESLFLFLSLAAFYYGLKKSYLLAGVFGALAAFTRITGLLLFLPLVWEYLQANKFRLRSLLNPKLILLALIPAATLSFFLFHYYRFGNFLLFFAVEKNWGRAFVFQGEHFRMMNTAASVNLLMDMTYLMFILFMTYFVFKRFRASYGLYMLSVLVVTLSTGTLMSIGRYILVLFPAYLVLASARNRLFRNVWITVSTILLAFVTILFMNGYWAG